MHSHDLYKVLVVEVKRTHLIWIQICSSGIEALWAGSRLDLELGFKDDPKISFFATCLIIKL